MSERRQVEEQDIPVRMLMEDDEDYSEVRVKQTLKGLGVVLVLVVAALVLTAIAVWNLARETAPKAAPVQAPPTTVIIDKTGGK